MNQKFFKWFSVVLLVVFFMGFAFGGIKFDPPKSFEGGYWVLLSLVIYLALYFFWVAWLSAREKDPTLKCMKKFLLEEATGIYSEYHAFLFRHIRCESI